MTSKVYAQISRPLYNLIIDEKKKLIKAENNKIRARKRQITIVIACQSLMKRIR